MKGKVLFLLMVLLLVVSCVPDGGIDTGDSSEDDSAVGEEEEESSVTTNEIWNVEDFSDLIGSNIVSIVPYSGWISQETLTMESSLSDYFDHEKDVVRREYYSFNGVMVYFETGDEALFYVKDVDGWLYYMYSDVQEDVESGETIEEVIGPVTLGVNTGADEPSKIGSVSVDGEYEFWVYPRYYTDDTTIFTTRTITYSSGESDSSDVTSDMSSLSVGGGSDESCDPDTSDGALGGPSSCMLYFTSGNSMKGTYTDSIYSEDEDGFETQIMKTEWSLVPIGEEGEELSEDFFSTEGFEDWLESV